jgi:hypothetical protein
LPARQLGRVLVGLVAHPDAVQQLAGALLGVRPRLPPDLGGAEGDVLQHRLVREEVEALEDHADVGAQPREVLALGRQQLAVDGDLTLVDRLQPVDRPAQRGLAGPGGPDDDDHLAAVDRQVDVLEHVQVPEPLLHVREPDERLAIRAAGHPPDPRGHRSRQVGRAITKA